MYNIVMGHPIIERNDYSWHEWEDHPSPMMKNLNTDLG